MASTPTSTVDTSGYVRVDGQALRRLRMRRGRTQTQAAKLASRVARNHWSKIERGHQPRVRITTAYRLARGVAAEGATDPEITAILPDFTDLT